MAVACLRNSSHPLHNDLPICQNKSRLKCYANALFLVQPASTTKESALIIEKAIPFALWRKTGKEENSRKAKTIYKGLLTEAEKTLQKVRNDGKFLEQKHKDTSCINPKLPRSNEKIRKIIES